jgi:hypothetical protein
MALNSCSTTGEWAVLFLLLLIPANAKTFVEPAERIEDAVLLDIQSHSEFTRYKFRLSDEAELLVELQPSEKAGSGACSGRGQTLSPRWELLERSVGRDEQPTFVQELCKRLSDPDFDLPEREDHYTKTPTKEKRTNLDFHYILGTVLLLTFVLTVVIWKAIQMKSK